MPARTSLVASLALLACLSAAAPADAAFAPAASAATGSLPHGVAVGDFNSDGKQDVVTSHNTSPGKVSVLGGNGDGSFTAAASPTVGGEARSIAVGDFTGDGQQDIVTASFNNTGTLSVLRGNGDLTFTTTATPGTGFNPLSVAVGDFNADGKQDLVTADTVMAGTITVILGNGNGTFGGGTLYDVGNNPLSVAVGDFNGDGKQDVVTANGNAAGTVSVLLGVGNGTFPNATPAGTFSVASHPAGIVVGDFNGDGIEDLATASDEPAGAVSVLVGDGHGAFTTAATPAVGAHPFSLAVGDFNGDDNQDLAAANVIASGTVSVLAGNGGGAFTTAATPAVGSFPQAIAVGDFDGDANQDLVTANHNSDGTVSVLRSVDPPPANLLTGGGAEGAGAAHTVMATPVPPGWTREQGTLTYVRYGTVGFPALLSAPPIRGGMAFFAGGSATTESAASQTVDVSADAVVVDQGRAQARLAADLGGFGSDANGVQVTATFLDAAGGELGTPASIGPVTAAQRSNVSRLLPRSTSVAVPGGTRRITVRMKATRGPGAFSQGYADNVALVLSGEPLAPAAPPPAGGSTPVPVAPGPTSLLVRGLGLKPASFRAAARGGSVGAARRAPVGTTVAYTLDTSATATFLVERPRPGVRKGKRCVAPPRKRPRGSKPKRCTRYAKVGSFTRASKQGANGFRFTGRIRNKALKRASYRLSATAKLPGGKAGKASTKRFKIVR